MGRGLKPLPKLCTSGPLQALEINDLPVSIGLVCHVMSLKVIAAWLCFALD